MTSSTDPDVIFDGFERDVMASESPFEVLVRGYLWLDKIVSTLLRAALPDPDRLTEEALDWMRFEHKLQLIEAQGNLAWPGSLRALVKVRNRLAHNPDIQIDQSVVEELVRSFEPDYGGDGGFHHAPVADPARPVIEQLRVVMHAMLIYLSSCVWLALSERVAAEVNGLQNVIGEPFDSDEPRGPQLTAFED